MKKLYQCVLVAGMLVGAPLSGSAQWFYDYAPPPTPYWTQGTNVTITSDRVDFNNATGNAFRRVYYPIDPALIPLTNRFRMDFEFLYNPNPSNKGIAHWLAAATSDTLDMTCKPVAITSMPGPVPTNIDIIGAYFVSPAENSPAGANVRIGTKHGTVQMHSSDNVLLTPNMMYYMTLERLSAGETKLSVFLNAARTQHASGSPVCYTTFDPATGTGAASLKYLQHGVEAWAGSGRTLTARVDNLDLDTIHVVPPPFVVMADQTLCAPGDIPNPLTSVNPHPFFVGSYQWQRFGPTPPWVNITLAVNPAYPPGPLSQTRSYRCLYIYGCTDTLISNPVTIRVNQFQPEIVCGITDDYSAAAPWTQTGTEVTINPLGYCLFKATSQGPSSQRVRRSVGLLPDTRWRADFDFTYDAPGSTNPHDYLAAFTNNTFAPLSASQDAIFVRIATTTAGMVQLWAGSRNDVDPSNMTPLGINLNGSDTYYISLERLCSTKGRLSVFSDPGRLSPVGTPQYFVINAGVTGLSRLQHANDVAYTSVSRLTAQIDNMCIDNLEVEKNGGATTEEESLEASNVLPDLLKVFPNPGTGIFRITSGYEKDMQLQVFNIQGQRIGNTILKAGTSYELDLSAHAKGMYLLMLCGHDLTESRKLILQ